MLLIRTERHACLNRSSAFYVAVTCLYASAFAAWALFGNQTDKKAHVIQGEVSQTRPLRDNLLYFAAAMAVVTLAIAVTIHDDKMGLHRTLRMTGLLGSGVPASHWATLPRPSGRLAETDVYGQSLPYYFFCTRR